MADDGQDATELTNPVHRTLSDVMEAARPRTDGEVARYIPELADVDPDQLGIALVSARGTVHEAGDSRAEFTIQSVSKPFVFALALDAIGLDEVTRHVGLEPSGEPFNAISLEASGRPDNPMINAGAIVASSLIPGRSTAEKFDVIRKGLSRFAARGLHLDESVYASEAETGDRNRALAYLTHSAGTLAASVDVATDTYFRQCSLAVTARDLAIMAATLATGGVNPVTRERVISEDAARWTSAMMTSCGMYDSSGEWLLKVGLPAKSGVGGGIVALQPEQFGVGTFSPRLDERGNSVRGIAMLETLSTRYGLHLLAGRGTALSPIGALDAEDGTTIARLRGDIRFAGMEEVLTRLLPLVHDDGCLVFDFSGVTRVAPGAGRFFRTVVDVAGTNPDGRARVEIRDPDGVLGA
ncbi:glutaminase A [Agromyces sp. SYSU T00194]|uniref:glutaminase A n=1 Tax=Agromyces chitinivorans TaxID=3158560 RepID=UPI0033986BD7